MPSSETNSMSEFWTGKRVLITGHTGFKGSWLALLLTHLGAEVHGYALKPPTEPNLFTLAELPGIMNSSLGDIRDLALLTRHVDAVQPEIIFHLAAQALVRESYQDPITTMATNIMGTAHLLEAVRHCPGVRAVVVVTTDKCYENPDDREQRRGFAETDKLGGHDPYSASKACAEIVAQSYRQSFCNSPETPAIATARAGNVIGGGDWARDRLLPDFFRAAETGQTLTVRNPEAVRPWQHVLDALTGYLKLGQCLYADRMQFASAWNFGPDAAAFATVREVIALATGFWAEPVAVHLGTAAPDLHEANYLTLDSAKAGNYLAWQPRWDFHQAVNATVNWHKSVRQGQSPRDLCCQQIQAYLEDSHAGNT